MHLKLYLLWNKSADFRSWFMQREQNMFGCVLSQPLSPPPPPSSLLYCCCYYKVNVSMYLIQTDSRPASMDHYSSPIVVASDAATKPSLSTTATPTIKSEPPSLHPVDAGLSPAFNPAASVGTKNTVSSVDAMVCSPPSNVLCFGCGCRQLTVPWTSSNPLTKITTKGSYGF
jgi:hypothetical protein